MKLSPIQKLDKVLKILSENTSNTFILFIVDKSNAKISGADATLVLGKLEKDGYVKYFDGNAAGTTFYSALGYSITFEGLVFYQQGGYERKLSIGVLNENRLWRNDTLLIRGTWFAGIAAIFLLLWQVYIYYYPPK